MNFIEDIASPTSKWAGGNALAYSLCIGIGMIRKALAVNLKKSFNDPMLEANLLTVRKELDRLHKDVEKLGKMDTKAYAAFYKSRLTKEPSKQKQHFHELIDISMNIIDKSGATFQWIQQINKLLDQKIKPHMLVACELTMGCIKGSLHLVRNNVNHIKSAHKKNHYISRIDQLESDYKTKYRETIKLLQQQL